MQLDWKDAAELTRKLKKTQSGDGGIVEFLAVALIVVLAVAFLFVPLMIYFVWSHALVIKVFWGWFVVKTFGLPALTWAQAWGLSMIVAYLTHVAHTCKSKDEREMSEKVSELVVLFLKPWIALGIGYICAHYFMHVV